MTRQPLRTRILISAVHGVEQLAGRALEALGATTAPEPSTHDDVGYSSEPNVAAVQKAQRAAAASGDHELAKRLADIERQLTTRENASDSVLPSYRAGLTAHDDLENIRKRLLANTPRPHPTDRG